MWLIENVSQVDSDLKSEFVESICNIRDVMKNETLKGSIEHFKEYLQC